MIGIDTNVLLRAVAADDTIQSPIARRFLDERSGKSAAVINAVVLVEFVWTLKSKYRATKTEIAGILTDILASPGFIVLERNSALQALELYRDGEGFFTDTFIARINSNVGCETTVTFDKGAPGAAGFTLLR